MLVGIAISTFRPIRIAAVMGVQPVRRCSAAYRTLPVPDAALQWFTQNIFSRIRHDSDTLLQLV
jgi:hypothetical protein